MFGSMCAQRCDVKNIFTIVRCVGQDCAMTYSGMRWESAYLGLFGRDVDACTVDHDVYFHVLSSYHMPWEATRAWAWDAAVDDDVEYLQRGRHDV